MALIELRGVSKIYHLGGEEIRALDNVDLDIHGGEFISIIGPSGSGKSTLARIVMALDRPTSGTVRFEGRDLFTLKPQALREALGVERLRGREPRRTGEGSFDHLGHRCSFIAPVGRVVPGQSARYSCASRCRSSHTGRFALGLRRQ